MTIQTLKKIELTDDHIEDVAEVHLTKSKEALLDITIFSKKRCFVLRLENDKYTAYEQITTPTPNSCSIN